MKHDIWEMKKGPTKAELRQLRGVGLSALCSLVLAARGVKDPQEALRFLGECMHEEILHDPFLMLDMDKAVDRLALAVSRRENIAVYGDYDVDGITATCLLTELISAFGCSVTSYIPDRSEEGYGLNKKAIKHLKDRAITLIITVDCGITAVEEVDFAKENGVDVIITDHHRCRDELPRAVAVVDPRRPGDPYPFKELAGVGVALKVALALAREEDRHQILYRFGELVAIGTIADVMSLTDENRYLVRQGLELLKNTRRPGLKFLLKETGAADGNINETTIGYTLAPRINAAGRMGRASLALEMLLTRIPARGEQHTLALCQLNKERQITEQSIFEKCEALLQERPELLGPALVLAGEGWHQGVVGIVASRLAEKYAKPAFMICLEGEKGKGSCRSCGGFNLFAALEKCADLLVEFGGHELAAGFTILRENVHAFRVKMCALVEEYTQGEPMHVPLVVDAEIEDCNILNLPEVESLSRLEPFGTGNPRPVFEVRYVAVISCADVGSGRHMKMRVRRDGAVLDTIFFSNNSKTCQVQTGDRLDLVFTPQVNEFRGERSVQLVLQDLRHSMQRSQMEQEIFARLQSGEYITRWEASLLIPERQDFAWVWRFLERSCAGGPVPATTGFFKQVSKNAAGHYCYGRTLVCLHVFSEVGLLQAENEGPDLLLSVGHPTKKANLEQAQLMKMLRSFLQ